MGENAALNPVRAPWAKAELSRMSVVLCVVATAHVFWLPPYKRRF
jgi:hypothetical protein